MLVAEREDDVLIITSNLLNLRILDMDLAGKILDLLYYRIFQSPSLYLRICEIKNFQSECVEYNIAKTMPFHVIEKIKKNE